MPRRLLLIPALLAFSVLSGTASAGVVISEIHYHPVEEPAFNSNGTPVLDLSADVHEFVELENTGAAPVDLSGWTLSGGIAFTFPPGTTLPAGGFRAVAANPVRLQTVYALPAGSVSGPYQGQLGNGGDTVRLRDDAGGARDAVQYGDRFPWPGSADALGAQDRFIGLSSASYPYKGRSLQRVSAAWNGSDPANWLASPLSPGPTPGGPQAVTRSAPKPVVLSLSHAQASDNAAIVRAGQPATVRVIFSGTTNLTAPQVEWFVDDLAAISEPRSTVPLATAAGGAYTATLPGHADRAIVRYRILANRGDGVEVVSPRADDPQIAPVGIAGAREAWHGYLVTPVRAPGDPAYDLLVSPANLSRMDTNIAQIPRRVTAYTATGMPREPPYVSVAQPHWNGTVPAVFAHDGVLYDVHLRHHGSRYHRAPANNSFKLHFPEHAPFQGQTAWFVTNHGAAFAEVTALNRLLGLPASRMRPVSLLLNNNASIPRYEQGEYAQEMLDEYGALLQRLNPGSSPAAGGELYKVVGNTLDASQNNLEGPYTKGDQAPMLSNAGWSRLQRYEWTYALQNRAWVGSLPIQTLVEGMWVARGDSPASPALDLAATRAWFAANFDLDQTLTSIALLQWAGVWDDAGHNQFFWRRSDGRWVRLGWDYDDLMTNPRVTQNIYANGAGAIAPYGPNWWKDTFFKAYQDEFRERLWDLNNSFLDPMNLAAMGLPNAAAFAASRQGNVNTQLGLGPYFKPSRPSALAPSAGAAVLPPATLDTSAYTHPTAEPHASTRWEIRAATGTYEDPVLRRTSASELVSLGIPFESLAYGQSYFWRAAHLDANGHSSVWSAESSFSYGTANPAAGAITLNEILARNRAAAENGGEFPDYIEIKNNGATAANLAGFTLSDDPANPARFIFPSGTVLDPGARLVVWCDSATGAPGLHAGFKLSADGQTVLLANGAAVIDTVTFGPQAPDLAIGRVSDGLGGWQACAPTPGLANAPAALAASSGIRINEWMASPASGPDWLELHNPASLPVSLGGLWLSDTPATPRRTQLPALSFLGAGGHQVFLADDSAAGANHCAFKLSAAGDHLLLTAADGLTAIDTVSFGAQAPRESQGRLPDGGSAIVSFPVTPTPGGANHLPAPVVLREALTHSGAPLEDYVELHNPGSTTLDLSGWWLSDDASDPRKFALPSGTLLAPDEALVIPESAFNTGARPFSLSSLGDEIVLSAVNANGALTGYRAHVRFGAAEENVSFGRVETAGEPEFWAQRERTPGTPNAPPRILPVVISEVHYHPPDLSGQDNSQQEFIELHNGSPFPVDIGGWRLQGGSDFQFPAGVSLPAFGYALLTRIDPSDATAAANFRGALGVSAAAPLYGPYSRKLANDTQRIELVRPGAPVGQTLPYLLVDRVEYLDQSPWPAAADGGGASLQRRSLLAIGNDAANWTAAPPSAGRDNPAMTDLAVRTPARLPGSVVNAVYGVALGARGGTPPYTWSLPAGGLPAGLTLAGDGVLSGAPSSAGLFPFTARVTDAAGTSVDQEFLLTVAEQPLAVYSSSPLPPGQAGQLYHTVLAAAGGTAPYFWSLQSGALPDGCAITPDGALSGTPTGHGPFSFTVRVDDAGGLETTASLTLEIVPAPLAITRASPLASAFFGAAYSLSLSAAGGTGGYQWDLVSGELPPGLTLSGAGVLSGAPSALTNAVFTARVTDSSLATATREYTLQVLPLPLGIATAALPSGILGDAYSFAVQVSGGAGGFVWSVAGGALPGGLSLDASGQLTGSPSAHGVFPVRLRVTDAYQATAERDFTLSVAPSGPLHHYSWDFLPSSAQLGLPFAVQITARDAADRQVVGHAESAALEAAVPSGSMESVVITEATDEAEDQFEIQNVSTNAVSTAGWYVRIGDSLSNIQIGNPTTWQLPGSLAPGEVLRISEQNGAGRLYFGGSIAWNSSNSRGWVMLIDDTHALRDFFAFGWSAAELAGLSVSVSGVTINPVASGYWSGPGAAPGIRGDVSSTTGSWSRTGRGETQTATDWAWRGTGQTFGATNPGLNLPWGPTTPVAFSPDSLAFSQGRFVGLLTAGQATNGVVLTVFDEGGHTGVSPALEVRPFTDSDADGMDDAWEAAHGLIVGANDADGDVDGDGAVNLAEFRAGTLPADAASFLRVFDAAGATGGELTLTWPAVAGKLYRLEASEDLADWWEIPPRILAAGPLAQATVPGPALGRLYVRVCVAQ